jgi:hypothetical protein
MAGHNDIQMFTFHLTAPKIPALKEKKVSATKLFGLM